MCNLETWVRIDASIIPKHLPMWAHNVEASFISLCDCYWNSNFKPSEPNVKMIFFLKIILKWKMNPHTVGWLIAEYFFSFFDCTREEAMCQQLLAYSLTATTPKATEIAVPPPGYLLSFPPISTLILRSFIHAAWGTGPGGGERRGRGGEGGQVQRSGKM